MSPHTIRRLFPLASASVLAANAGDYGDGQPVTHEANPIPSRRRKAAKLERAPGNAALGAAQAQGRDSGRFHVRITATRKRLLDEDNLCGKYHCDLLRYAGVIPDDAPGCCKIETVQVKAEKGEAESVLIEVFAT